MVKDMKQEVKELLKAMKERDIRNFLNVLNIVKLDDIEYLDEKTGLNVLHICAQENFPRELLLIINRFPNLNLNIKNQGIAQRTPLDLAVYHNNKEVSKILIENGADITLWTPKEVKRNFKGDNVFIKLVEDLIKKALDKNELLDKSDKKRYLFN